MEGEHRPVASRPMAKGHSLPCATQGMARGPDALSKFQEDTPKEDGTQGERETNSFSKVSK